MEPGSKDQESKQEAVREETMEVAMAVAKATETMVTAVVMLEYLEEGKTDVEKIVALHFFSHALAGQDGEEVLPPHSPGHLPGLVPLLADCVITKLNPIRDEAMLSLIHLLRHYAHILEPTETEMTSLEVALNVVDEFIKRADPGHTHKSLINAPDMDHISQVFPTIISIFQEPGNRTKAQAHAASCLASLAHQSQETCMLIDMGVMEVLMETVRVGKASPAVLTLTSFAITRAIERGDDAFRQSAANAGLLDVVEEVLKRPNQALKDRYLGKKDAWGLAVHCLSLLPGWPQEQVLEAILSPGGPMEHMLKMGLMSSSKANGHRSSRTLAVMEKIRNAGSESQMRRLMSSEFFHPFISSQLHPETFRHLNAIPKCLTLVEACLEHGTEQGRWLQRRLMDQSGITDAVDNISRRYCLPLTIHANQARHIYNTYLKNPLPPRPPSNLPFIIYTKNFPQ